MLSSTGTKTKRLGYLDSARGLAALSVITWHFFTAFYNIEGHSFVQDSPLHIFWYGPSDVTFFFIHSGFILTYTSQKFLKGIQIRDYIGYLIRRICRIYPLYIFILLLSHLAYNTIYPMSSGRFLSDHFREFWKFPAKTWIDVLKEAVLIVRVPESSVGRYMPQDWTLAVELYASAVLPFLCLFMKKNSWLCCLGILLLARVPGLCTYILEFGIGVFLFNFMDRIHQLWNRTGAFIHAMVIGLAILLSTCFFQFSDYLGGRHILFRPTIDRLIVAGGCGLWFLVLLNHKWLQKLLSKRFFSILGEACYALYLFHLMLLILFVDYGYQLLTSTTSLPIWAVKLILLLVTMVSTIALSLLSYFTLERPAIRLGKRLNTAIVNRMVFSGVRRQDQPSQ